MFLVFFGIFCGLSAKGQEADLFLQRDNEAIIERTILPVNQFLKELSDTRVNREQQLKETVVWLETQTGVVDATIFRQSCLCQSCVETNPMSVMKVLVEDNGAKKELYFRISMGNLMQVANFSWDNTVYRWLWSLQIKQKPQTDERYLATEDPEIKAILLRHDVELNQSSPNTRNSALMLYYTLRGNSCWMNVVKELFATGKFKNRIYHDGWTSASALCTNPVSVNDPDFVNTHGWPLRMINAPCAWTITRGNANVLIGIADTEFDTTHDELQNQIVSIHGPTSAGNFHGTAVASVAAAATHNGRGIASIGYNSRIRAHRVPHAINPDTGRVEAWTTDVRIAIMNLFGMNVPIINASWEDTGLREDQAQIIIQGGTTLVLSGGNSVSDQNHDRIATIPGVIVVSGVNQSNMIGPTDFSRSQWIDIVAPGENIRVAMPGNRYENRRGTSYAAPFVAGTVALMLSVNPSLTPARIEEVLKATAAPIADGHLLPGRGRLNAFEAVRAVELRISAPSIICSTAIMSADNWISGSRWEVSNNLQINGANNNSSVSVSRVGNSSGTGEVRIMYNDVILAWRNVWVGLPDVGNAISGPTSVRVGSSERFTLPHSGGTVTWDVTGFPHNNAWPNQDGNSATIAFNAVGNWIVTANVANPCGSVGRQHNVSVAGFSCLCGWFPCICRPCFCAFPPCVCGAFLVHPNPASDILNIDISQQTMDYVKEKTAQQSITNFRVVMPEPVFSIRLYNDRGDLVRQMTTRGGKMQFNVSNLPTGVYSLHIYDGVSCSPNVRQIIIRR